MVEVIGSSPIISTTGRTLPWAYPKIVSALVAIVQGLMFIKDTLIKYQEVRRTPNVRGGIVNCHYRKLFLQDIFQLTWNIIYYIAFKLYKE